MKVLLGSFHSEKFSFRKLFSLLSKPLSHKVQMDRKVNMFLDGCINGWRDYQNFFMKLFEVAVGGDGETQ